MGRSSPRCQPRCSKCYKEASKKMVWDKHGVWHIPQFYHSVEAIGRTDTNVTLQCRRCGHRYKSTSKAAFRLSYLLTTNGTH